MSKAPKVGYSRTETADGGVQFTYTGSRFKPGLQSLMAASPGVLIFLFGCFGISFNLMGPLFFVMIGWVIFAGLVLNRIPRSFTVYPDRVVTFDGQSALFKDITHLGWERGTGNNLFPGGRVYAQTRGLTLLISGYVKPNIALGLETEIKLVSDTNYK